MDCAPLAARLGACRRNRKDCGGPHKYMKNIVCQTFLKCRFLAPFTLSCFGAKNVCAARDVQALQNGTGMRFLFAWNCFDALLEARTLDPLIMCHLLCHLSLKRIRGAL